MPSLRPAVHLLFRPSAWVTGLVWGAATLSLGFWFWCFPVASEFSAPEVMIGTPEASPAQTGSLSRMLGAEVMELPESETDRLQLVGVISGLSGQGSALITLDGQAPKPYLVGQTVGDKLVLQSLEARKAHLGTRVNGPKLRTLQLPTLQTP